MNVSLALSIFAVGAAAIAMWLVVRFPSLGPGRLVTAFAAGVVAAVALQVALVLIDPVAGHAPYGVAVALMLVILPALVGMFWTLARMLRLLASLRA